MKILSLELKNFRNYNNQTVNFSDGINVLTGKNAQGKTNLLDAVFLCSIGKSPRTNKDKELIMWNKELSKVLLNLNKKSGNKKIEIYISSKINKTIKINSMPIKRMGELMGEFNSIYFSPDELKLVKESPDQRRRFMDIDLCQFSKTYFYTLNNYNKILQQRNKLLKSTKSAADICDSIEIWNEQLAKHASFIIIKRIELINKLKIYANEILLYLTDNKENLQLEYSGFYLPEQEELKKLLLQKYKETLEKDILLRYTTIGPHKDDIKIIVNNIDIRHYGSQGQQRTCALALKLAELEVFNSTIGEYPVLLLDDVLSELDSDRQLKLLNRVKNVQTLITCTGFNYQIPHTQFEIVNGAINKITKFNNL